MIRIGRRFGPAIGSAWRKRILWGIFLIITSLAPVAASADSKKGNGRESRRVERFDGHHSRRDDVPRNARYKNPTRNARQKDPPRNARYKNPRRDDRRFATRDRDERGGHSHWSHDDRRHHRKYGKQDHGRHAGRHHDHRKRHDHYRKPHYRHERHHKHRTRVYHHYEYVPYYVPVVDAYPYYCELCHSGFYAEHLFYDHLCDVHHVARVVIPRLLYFHGGTFYFGGW